MGGNNTYSGEVEVFYQGYWSDICSYSWDYRDADVVCRELGYSGAMAAYVYRSYYSYTALSNVYCTGNESSLLDCPARYNSYCSSKAGVSCIRKCVYIYLHKCIVCIRNT